jgi:hypothetical protein
VSAESERMMSTATTNPPPTSCDRPGSVTRSLLGYGVLAGPFYLIAGLTEALTRDGFDLPRHDLSLLANGPLGWIHIVVLVLTGVMVIAAATGIGRALSGRPGGRWAARLIAGFGLGMVGAGAFVADPMNGFPAGTADGPPTNPTLHGLLHMATGGLGFLCLIAATFVLGRTFARSAPQGWAWFSRATGVVFLVGFAGIASGSASPAIVLGFWAAVTLAFAWLAALSIHLYRAH